MALFEDSTRRFLKHTIGNFIVLFVMFAVAAALDQAEHWCESCHMSLWLTSGLQSLAIFAFVADASVFVCMVWVTSFHMIRSMFQSLESGNGTPKPVLVAEEEDETPPPNEP